MEHIHSAKMNIIPAASSEILGFKGRTLRRSLAQRLPHPIIPRSETECYSLDLKNVGPSQYVSWFISVRGLQAETRTIDSVLPLPFGGPRHDIHDHPPFVHMLSFLSRNLSPRTFHNRTRAHRQDGPCVVPWFTRYFIRGHREAYSNVTPGHSFPTPL